MIFGKYLWYKRNKGWLSMIRSNCRWINKKCKISTGRNRFHFCILARFTLYFITKFNMGTWIQHNGHWTNMALNFLCLFIVIYYCLFWVYCLSCRMEEICIHKLCAQNTPTVLYAFIPSITTIQIVCVSFLLWLINYIFLTLILEKHRTSWENLHQVHVPDPMWFKALTLSLLNHTFPPQFLQENLLSCTL